MKRFVNSALSIRPRFSGAAISGKKLAISTIEQSASGRLSRIAAACERFELADRDQVSTISFQKELRAFCRRHELSRLFFRINMSGQYGTFKRETFKIEAVLELIPSVQIFRAYPVTIENWRDHNDGVIPACAPVTYQTDRTLEQQALDVAAYFARNEMARAAKPRVTSRQLRDWHQF